MTLMTFAGFMRRRAVLGVLSFAAIIFSALHSAQAANAVVLEQVVSRHDPHFKVAAARLAVGRDGNIYLGNGSPQGGYVLRVSPDGKTRFGGTVGYSLTSLAASKDGTVATSEAHFSHRVAFWGRDFTALGNVPDFLVNDQVQWNAPSDIVAGEAGDFFGIDQHRLRILRVQAPDKLVTSYSLAGTGEQSRGSGVAFRVWEAGERFVTAWHRGIIHAISFDGTELWSIQVRPAGENMGAFDLDEAGRLYVLSAGDTVRVFDADGKPAGEVKLQPEPRGKLAPVTDLRILGGELIVKRSAPDTLFEAYDRSTGALLRRVEADVETLRVAYPAPVWTAGQNLPFDIQFRAPRQTVKPRLRVWLRPLGIPEFKELPWDGGQVAVPADARGLYQVRVAPDVRGRVAEYIVDGYVEIRVPNSTGSVALLTPLNRFYYGRQEQVPVQVIARAAAGTPLPETVAVRLQDASGRVLAERPVKLTGGKGECIFALPEISGLNAQDFKAQTGRFIIDASLPGFTSAFTVAPQPIEIGAGLADKRPLKIIQHGDYTLGFPTGPRSDGSNLPRWEDLPDTVSEHVSRSRTLGQNLFVDRLGQGLGLGGLGQVLQNADLVARLTADPAAIPPEKAQFEGPLRRTIAGYGATGIEEQGILLYMDAGLPLGTLFDTRKPEQMEKDLQSASRNMLPYPAFRGWSWAANWWLEKHGATAAETDAEKAEYTAALKAARDTGAWSSVLEVVSDRTFAHAVNAEQRMRHALQAVAPGKLSVSTGPYRAIQTHPPVIFRNSDEVDLHYQGEQIQPPQVAAHHVDFYKRPGKRAWAHPELWNDDGTGGMIYPTLLQMAMRGVDGVGQSGPIQPGWGGRSPDRADPRSGGAGATSSFRAAYELLGQRVPWESSDQLPSLGKSTNADRLAIVVSTRMQRIETWDGKIGSAYFDALFEAYNACLYAHRPASFVFVEDLQPETLQRYQAILVVSQRVELDPPLAAALDQARRAGVKIYHDGTCRPELVKDTIPLGIAFDRVSQDPSAWQDDAAYDRFPRYFKTHAAKLRDVLGPVVKPVAECANPEVLFSERALDQGQGRYVWAVNNTMLGWDPGLAWRTTLLMTQRVPVLEPVGLDVPAGFVVYDVFAGKTIAHDQGKLALDLRSVPARLLAVVPANKVPANNVPAKATEPPAEERFGPHIRDVAVSSDGQTALLTAFNWDHNLYGVDLNTGDTRWRNRIGHAFAFDSAAQARGFTAQGYDVTSAEGYHLYLVGNDGQVERRFALFGLPKRGTSWAAAETIQDAGINSFASAPNGTWFASAGDLGVAVWDRAGKLLWADDWWKTARKRVRLLPLGNQALVVLDQGTAHVRNIQDGSSFASIPVADTGSLRGGAASDDAQTLVLHSDTLGGRFFVIRDKRIVNEIPAAADQFALAADGSFLVAVDGRQLKTFDVAGGLLWTYTGNDTLRQPQVSPDGRRIAVGSELGTLAVLNRNGGVLLEHDLQALPVPAWLPNGDLFAATWMGAVVRYGADLKPLWTKRLTPTETDARSKLVAAETTPTVRRTGWGNAAATPLPLVPNLLTESRALIGAYSDPPSHGDPRPWQNKIQLLTDGQPDAPPEPWLSWSDIGMVDSGWRSKLALQVDTFRTQLRVTAITFVEDPAHPESWLRDVRLQWWDATAEDWRNGPLLLSNAAVHTHVLDKPVEAARFRFISTGGGSWPVGNLRLGELVFHGEALGASHPDAVAKKPALVLFDERESDLNSLKYPGRSFSFRYNGAFSGGKCLELASAGETGPNYIPPYGHAVPNWNFEIAENPQPGQYRYLQFAWKANSAQTTGIGLLLGKSWPGGGAAVSVGDLKWSQGVTVESRIDGPPPAEWKTVRVDLWTLTKGKPPRIEALNLQCTGDGACFDQIVLGRTEADLPPMKP